MHMRGRRLRFTAVLALVVLALTGFSSGRGHGHGHGSGGSDGGGGGGCSSSRQDHDGSSSTSGGGSSGSNSYNDHDDYDDDYDDDPYGSGSSGDSYEFQDATAKLIGCATEKAPYATVEVTNPNDREGRFSVSVRFKDKKNGTVISQAEETDVPANGKVTVKVEVGRKGLVPPVDHCEADERAPSLR